MVVAEVFFVVLAHTRPAQVARLTNRLAPYPALLHVDGGTDGPTWQEFCHVTASQPNVTLLPRHRTGWASWGLVAAAVEGLRAALGSEFSHVVLMTGQDYLLRPVDEVAAFFAAEPGTSWVPFQPLPISWITDKDGGWSRFSYWNMPVSRRRLRLPARRRLPQGIIPCYGQAQWAMARPLAEWVVQQVDRRPELARFFRWTWCPDELFFSSLAASSPMAAQVRHQDNLWVSDWSAGGSHPKTFCAEDVEKLLAKSKCADGRDDGAIKLFARKFDAGVDSAPLDALDGEVAGPSRG
jgi:Core-2/I-Branching enzyme